MFLLINQYQHRPNDGGFHLVVYLLIFMDILNVVIIKNRNTLQMLKHQIHVIMNMNGTIFYLFLAIYSVA
jgi:hypothetical protein